MTNHDSDSGRQTDSRAVPYPFCCIRANTVRVGEHSYFSCGQTKARTINHGARN